MHLHIQYIWLRSYANEKSKWNNNVEVYTCCFFFLLSYRCLLFLIRLVFIQDSSPSSYIHTVFSRFIDMNHTINMTTTKVWRCCFLPCVCVCYYSSSVIKKTRRKRKKIMRHRPRKKFFFLVFLFLPLCRQLRVEEQSEAHEDEAIVKKTKEYVDVYM